MSLLTLGIADYQMTMRKISHYMVVPTVVCAGIYSALIILTVAFELESYLNYLP